MKTTNVKFEKEKVGDLVRYTFSYAYGDEENSVTIAVDDDVNDLDVVVEVPEDTSLADVVKAAFGPSAVVVEDLEFIEVKDLTTDELLQLRSALEKYGYPEILRGTTLCVVIDA